jgi:hypothetical protein
MSIMPEVFAISGAPFGAALEKTPKGNYGAPVKGCPADRKYAGACRSLDVMALQKAIASLGKVYKDSSLSNLKADGILGEDTALAINRIFQAVPGNWPKMSVNLDYIAQNIDSLTPAITSAAINATAPKPPVTATPAPAQPQTALVPVQQAQMRPQPQVAPQQFVPAPSDSTDTLATWGLIGLITVGVLTGLWLASR